jgi:hypothetical protein
LDRGLESWLLSAEQNVEANTGERRGIVGVIAGIIILPLLRFSVMVMPQVADVIAILFIGSLETAVVLIVILTPIVVTLRLER